MGIIAGATMVFYSYNEPISIRSMKGTEACHAN